MWFLHYVWLVHFKILTGGDWTARYKKGWATGQEKSRTVVIQMRRGAEKNKRERERDRWMGREGGAMGERQCPTSQSLVSLMIFTSTFIF